MTTKSTPRFEEKDLQGFKFLDPLQDFLTILHRKHNHFNRQLHFDEFTLVLLFYFLNPILSSLRGLQHAGTFKSVQERLKIKPRALSTYSEAAQIFDPELLAELVRTLAETAIAQNATPRPESLQKDLRVLAADATLWSFLPRMAPLFFGDGPKKGIPPSLKGHVQFDVFKGIPVDADITYGLSGDAKILKERLQKNTLYLFDSGYIDFELFQNIRDIESEFITRAKSNMVFTDVQENVISQSAREAGVYFDAQVRLGSGSNEGKIKKPMRLIKATVQVDASNNLCPKRKGDSLDPKNRHSPRTMELVLITSCMDMPAELIVELYRYRWQIELFFRWFKNILGCKHFVFESENGLQLQVYAALIATLLVILYTKRKPNKRFWETFQFYLAGWVSLTELDQVIENLKPLQA